MSRFMHSLSAREVGIRIKVYNDPSRSFIMCVLHRRLHSSTSCAILCHKKNKLFLDLMPDSINNYLNRLQQISSSPCVLMKE
jgi:hypothetical protein